MFLYKFNLDILSIEYPYLHLQGEQKKFLALYPNILLKCKDLGAKAHSKQQFQLLIGGVLGNSGHIIKSDQIEAITVSKIVILCEKSKDQSHIDLQNKYKNEYLKKLKKINVIYLEEEYTSVLNSL